MVFYQMFCYLGFVLLYSILFSLLFVLLLRGKEKFPNIRKISFLKSIEKRLFSCFLVFFWKQTSMLSPGFPCSLDPSITSVCLIPVTTYPWSPGDAGLCETMFIVLFARLHQRQKKRKTCFIPLVIQYLRCVICYV